jgi:integrase/recombinase XerD
VPEAYYSEYTSPVVHDKTMPMKKAKVLAQGRQIDARERYFMGTIQWQHYPYVAENPHARAWLETQAMLCLADNTIKAYGRSTNDYLAFCQRASISFVEATRADIALYVDDMLQRPNSKGENIRYLHSGVGLANATLHQRLTVVRLLYDYLLDERVRQEQTNPVGKGKYTPGRAFAGKRERAMLPRYERLPWIPGDDQWNAILDAAALEPVRNQLMLLLAYYGALRRSELVALEVRDIAFPLQQITIRPEATKNGSGRVVMYGDVARELLQVYMDERADDDIRGGYLFRSQSDRNSAQGFTADTWDKVVTRIAKRVGLHHLFTTHTTRHLRLTDLARCGMDIHAIAHYAGHRSIETTKIYLKLSGRETAERVRLQMHELDKRLACLRQGGQG